VLLLTVTNHTSAALPCSAPLQILAPTDDAFDAMLLNLGGGQQKLPLDQLLRLPQLRNILQYHIVPGEYTSSEWLGSLACQLLITWHDHVA
jgi:uncharacterized surface protein with fasciclin (FAS1) repeats